MKIKSHTGEIVEARVGMVVVSFDKFSVSDRQQTIREPDLHRRHLDNFIMLHCPFQVGDEYHVYREGLCGFEDRWFEGQFFDNQEDADMANAGKFTMQRRHANPNLRDAPEYVK